MLFRSGNGSWRLRVKALGNSKCRASAANSSEWIRPMSWEKRVPKVNAIFCCHAHSPFRQQIENKPIKSTTYGANFILTSVDCPTTPKISVPFGELAIGGEGPAGVGLRYLAGRHAAGAQWGKNSWRVSLPLEGKHVL